MTVGNNYSYNGYFDYNSIARFVDEYKADTDYNSITELQEDWKELIDPLQTKWSQYQLNNKQIPAYAIPSFEDTEHQILWDFYEKFKEWCIFNKELPVPKELEPPLVIDLTKEIVVTGYWH